MAYDSFDKIEDAVDVATRGFYHTTPVINYSDARNNTLDLGLREF